MYAYDKKFYEYISKGSTSSAKEILPILIKNFNISDVLDVGCGAGAWLKVWQDNQVDVVGIDGDYVDRDNLLIQPSSFEPRDLRQPFNLNRKFSIVQSLEVAEHLPKSSASDFVKSLCAHSDLVMFSAAPPGQGGDNHVNEQPYSFWQNLFSENNYVALDFIRPLISDNDKVEPWYKYNTVIYVKREFFETLSDDLKASRVDSEIQDVSPFSYKVRKTIIRLLPTAIATKVAKIKEHMMIQKHKRASH